MSSTNDFTETQWLDSITYRKKAGASDWQGSATAYVDVPADEYVIGRVTEANTGEYSSDRYPETWERFNNLVNDFDEYWLGLDQEVPRSEGESDVRVEAYADGASGSGGPEVYAAVAVLVSTVAQDEREDTVFNAEDFSRGSSSGMTQPFTPVGGDPDTVTQRYKHGSTTESLKAYYPFDRTLHDHALNHHLTNNGASFNGSGRVGDDSVSFNATNNDYLETSYDGLGGNPPLTFSCWARSTKDSTWYSNNNSWAGMICSEEGENSHQSFLLAASDSANSNQISIHIWSDSIPSGLTWEDLGLDQWHHIVGVNDPESGEQRIYINGNLEGTGTYNLSLPDGGTWNIGARRNSSSNHYFYGSLDDVRIYDRALSEPEVQALYNLTSPSGSISATDPREGLIREYKLDGDVTDSVNSADGTNNGVTFVDGYDNQAGEFVSSESDYIQAPALNIGTPITYSAWIKSDRTGTRQDILDNAQGDTTGATFIWRNDDTIDFTVGDGSTWVNTNGPTLTSGVWYHIVGIASSTRHEVWVNGELKDSQAGVTYSGNSEPFEISRQTALFDGNIDEVRVYDRALSHLEVQRLYELGQRKIDDGDMLL